MTQKERKKEGKKERKKERKEERKTSKTWEMTVCERGQVRGPGKHEFSHQLTSVSVSTCHELCHVYITNCIIYMWTWVISPTVISHASRLRTATGMHAPHSHVGALSRRAPPAISYNPYRRLNSRRFKFVLDPKINKLFFQRKIWGLRLVRRLALGKAEVDFCPRKGTLGCFESGFQGLSDPA